MAKKYEALRKQIENHPAISPLLRNWVQAVNLTMTWPATTTTTTTTSTT